MIKVYIASPYTIGDVAVNVKLQMDTMDQLMTLGFVPYAPLFTHFQHMVHPRPVQDWLNLDNAWLRECDCLLRLGGESSGADDEVKLASSMGMPVFMSIDELIKCYQTVLDYGK